MKMTNKLQSVSTKDLLKKLLIMNQRQHKKVVLVTGSRNKKKEGGPSLALSPGPHVLTLLSK